jgi:hypothetical protein
MKKIIAILVLSLVFNSCDDGDLTLESFNFSNQAIQKCSDPNKTFLYKINGEELLVLNTDATIYTLDPNETNFPYTKTYQVGSTYGIFYRIYDTTASTTTICSTIAPATPIVINEWNATGGTIEVTTSKRFATDGTTLLGYTYSIKLLNVNFANSNNSFSFEEYLLGDYQP